MNTLYRTLELFAKLPLSWLRALGWLLGSMAFYFNKKRRHVTHTNLRLAFPNLNEPQITTLTKRHLRYMGIALLDRIWLWFAPLSVVYSRINLTGFEHLPNTETINHTHNATFSQGAILFVPHFVGLEAAGPAWVAECQRRGVPVPEFVNIFQAQHTEWEDALYRHGRGRFAKLVQFTRQTGIRPVIKGMRQGQHFYCSPDNDHGEKDAVFVPFFGTSAATLAVLPKLSALLQAPVIPLIAKMTPTGYSISALPPLAIMGTNPLETELATINATLEEWVRTMPEQYFFSHRRYKTRPIGQPNIY